MYLSLIEHELKTTSPIVKILTFLNQDFSDLIDILRFIFRFSLAGLCNF